MDADGVVADKIAGDAWKALTDESREEWNNKAMTKKMKTIHLNQVAEEPADELLKRLCMSHNDFGRAFAALLLSRKELIQFDRLTAYTAHHVYD